MRKVFYLTSVFILFSFCGIAQTSNPNLGIIPAPKSISIQPGQFVFGKDYAILFENAEDQKIALLFQEYLKTVYSLDLLVAKNFIKAPAGIIRFSSAGYKGQHPEGYSLTVTPNQIDVNGKGAGLFYGLQTLLQLFPVQKGAELKINGVIIEDEPRYQYRGMHLDVGRHMFPVTFIKKYIDLLAQYKLNTFHWHLTEDQGWRIEIKKYPKLAQIGGSRDQTLIGHFHDRFPQRFDNTPYEGFYTQEEVKEVVAYATSKYVTVIPEIEMPGHSVAALAAYPELACGDKPGPFKVAEKWGIFPDIYCAGKEQTFNFLQDVLDEVMALFPSTYIHIGGDEAPKTNWKMCKYCQKRIRDNKLKNEHGLQSYFIHRIEKYLNSKGRQIIGWDEILQGGLAPNATVMSWQGIEGGIAAAKQKHKAIMTPGSKVYFDHYQGNPVQEPLAIHGLSTLESVYNYNPTPEDLPLDVQKYIIGVQANVWTEYMKTPAHVEYMVLPRLYSLSEIAWTAPDRKNLKEFKEERVPRHLALLDQSAETMYRVPTAIGAKDTTMLGAEFTLTYKSPVEGAKIYYTIDGYPPRETEYVYEKPIQISVPADDQRVLKTVVVTPSGKRSATTTTILSNALPLPAIETNASNPGLKHYYVPGYFASTAEVDTLKATERGISTVINLTKFRNKSRTYGLILEGYIQIEEDGIYAFTTSSDDGSQLWIDGALVVDNDGRHTSFELTGATNLLKGLHKIQIRYFQAGGQSDLRVFMAQPGKTRTEIPTRLLLN
ncbi:MAG TPA: family 20 glycosylhydrolase [Daejeonella sp.]|nr:family 20 glycosylhydrolase [Daejeonella sp.]